MIAASILRLYTRPKVKLETLEAKVEEIRKVQQEARLRNKLLPPHQQQNTPLAPVVNTFSPVSRGHSPRSSSNSAAPHNNGKAHARKYKDHRTDSDSSRSSRKSSLLSSFF